MPANAGIQLLQRMATSARIDHPIATNGANERFAAV